MGEKKVAETLYKYLLNKPINRYFGHDIKWLERDDSDIFNNHLELCGQAKINKTMWDKMYDLFRFAVYLFFC